MSEPLVRGPERTAPTAPTDAAPRVRQPLRAAMIAAGSLAVAGFLAGVAVGWVTTPMDFTAGDLTPDPIGASARDIARNNLGVAAMILGLGMVTLAAAPAAIAAASVIPGALLLGAALRLPRPETTGRTVRRFIATLAVGVAVLCIAAVIEDLVSTTAIGSVLS